jgi:hypothetical protein
VETKKLRDGSVVPVVKIPTKRIPITFALLAVLLLTASISIDVLRYKTAILSGIGSYDRLLPMFDVDMETSLPTLISALMLLSCAALTYSISRIDAAERAKRWIGVCLVFLILFFDESVMLHEASVKVPLALGLLVLALTGPHKYPEFLLDMPKATLGFLAAGATIYLFGAVVVDTYNSPYLKEFGYHNLGYKFRATVEEALEMGGIVLFTTGLVHQLKLLGVTELHFGTSARSVSREQI